MIIEFSVGNFKSIRDIATISFQKVKALKEPALENTFTTDRYELIKSAVIYGANSSGKSNFLSAIGFYKWFVINSSKSTQKGEEININSFELNDDFINEPSYFQSIFLINNIKYRYGFEVSKEKVHNEWLYYSKKTKETELFFRHFDDFEIHEEFSEGENLETKTRDNALFLSVVAQFNGEISNQLLKWFRNLNQISGLQDQSYEGFTLGMFQNPNLKPIVKEFLDKADLGFTDLMVEEFDITKEKLPTGMPDSLKEKLIIDLKGKKGYNLVSIHNKYDKNHKVSGEEYFPFEKYESEGTKKYFRIVGPVLDTLQHGKVLVIDELDARLHPSLTTMVVQLFNSKVTNKKNAQLLFATHDTNLLNSCTFRRDQIWFAEKDYGEGTTLFSLAEYKTQDGLKVRNDEAYEKNYIAGKYGAIPFVGDFSNIFTE